MTDPIYPAVSEQVFELRFTPSAKILDRRGEWAERLSTELALPRWQIGRDRVDVYSEDERQRAFVSHRNAGFIVLDSDSTTLHAERSQRFMRILSALDGFRREISVDRLGVRGRYCVGFSGTFEALRARITSRYVSVPDALRRAYGQNLAVQDIGISLNFRDGSKAVNTSCGPMLDSKLASHFRHRRDFPPVSLYLDIDTFRVPKATATLDAILKNVKEYSDTSRAQLQAVASLLLGE